MSSLNPRFSGHAVNARVDIGKAGYVIIAVNGVDKGAEFKCPLGGVTLNGDPAARVGDVSNWCVDYRRVNATVINPDWLGTIGEIVACDAIQLTAEE